ncbi:MAG TPA: hypothetical protein VI542_17250 [Candidatus Tectomicrobia bacterium]
MHPSPSLHYVAPLLEQRRKRHRRARRLWGISALLLGLGLLLGGGWVTLHRVPRATPQAAVVAPAVPPTPPVGATATRARPVEPLGEHPVLLGAEAWSFQACQTLSPRRTGRTPGEDCNAGGLPRPWETTMPTRTPGVLALTGQEPGAIERPGAPASTTPPRLPGRAALSPPRLSATSCKAMPCPAAPAGRRPPPAPARLTTGRRPQATRSAGTRQPVRPVPPQRHVSAYGPPVLGEPERLLVSPAGPERLLVSP